MIMDHGHIQVLKPTTYFEIEKYLNSLKGQKAHEGPRAAHVKINKKKQSEIICVYNSVYGHV